jgi:release factor glutamine methyltransferase
VSAAAVARTDAEPLTVLSVMLRSADYLAGKGVESARLDAEHLLASVLGVGRLEMYLQHERPMTPDELERFRPLLKRRGQREPLQYILGRQGFRELDLEVGPGVLVPRPETEQLVEVVLAWARDRRDLVALDVGTGSGAIAMSLLVEGPFGTVVGTDASPDALAWAARNRAAAGLDSRLELREGRLFETLHAGETFDAVVSNPPYVAEADRGALQPEVADWEPEQALFAGKDGLAVLRELVPGAGEALRPGGLLALEIGEGQAEGVVELVDEARAYEDTTVHRDLAGKKRIVTARKATGRADKGG